MTLHAISRPVALARGDVLRIRHGGGLTLRPTSGVLWVTEEGIHDDRMIAPGDLCQLEGMGLALAYAHRTSCVVIDVPATIERSPDVRLALHGSDEARRVPLNTPPRRGVLARVRALWRTLRRVRERSSSPDAPVGGHYEHDAFLSSRRTRGVAERFHIDPRDPLSRSFVPPY